MNKNFEEYARYYNLFYGDKAYKNEAKTIDTIIKKYDSINAKLLLNVGCGTGKHDVEIANLGYQIKGIDLSPDMIDIAKKNSKDKDIIFEVGDARTFSDDKKYDVVTSLFHVMSYQTSNEDLLSSFEMVNRELKKDGLFLFDAWYGPGVLSDKPEVRIKQVEDDTNIFIRHAIPVIYPDKNVVDVNYEVLVVDKATNILHNIKETHKMRYLFTPEVELMLNSKGFELIACIDCNSLDKVDFNSWTAYFVARKVSEI